jgi:hypothetical protein
MALAMCLTILDFVNVNAAKIYNYVRVRVIQSFTNGNLGR